MENRIISAEQFSSRDISTSIGLLGLMSATLALIAIILCLARRTKSVSVLETERRTEHSCKIFLLEPPPPPPPYCSLSDCQQPPSYQWAVLKIWSRTRKTIHAVVSDYQLQYVPALRSCLQLNNKYQCNLREKWKYKNSFLINWFATSEQWMLLYY